MRRFPLTAIALAMLAATAAASAQGTTELNKVTVTGEGDKLGTGLLMDEDAPKSRSSVTKAQLEKTRSSGNPFQALSLLPGVNSSSYDATGLFGGNLRVRGFNSDQMGFTVNGAPVNDSGNFAVFPQEYVDQENLCSLYVTQGSADTDAPHVGASGGNVGIQTCAPENERRTRIAISGGQLGYYRLFGRVDTGQVGAFKGFLSISDTQADKWKGQGNAKRDHLDTGAEFDLGAGNKVSASFLYNHAINNNFLALPQYYTPGGSLAATAPTFANSGYYADYNSIVPQHQPAGPGAQNDATYAPNKGVVAPNPAYYGYSLNPFDDGLFTVKGSFALTDKLRVDVQPYLWYGYGTGGTEQNFVAESQFSATQPQVHGGVGDLNGDGDRLDNVLVYRGSVTKTVRPGITTTLTYVLDNQKITGGFWFERARHRQTQPATTVDNNGNIADYFLASNQLRYNDGALYQGRDWLTISTGSSVFLQDTVDLLGGRLQVTPAVSYRRINRDFSNYANSGTNGAADYELAQAYGKVLPSLALSFQATDRVQVFGSISRNFRVPSNFEFGNLNRGSVTYVNGAGVYSKPLGDLGVKPEVSTNIDFGSRYRGDLFRLSATGFYNRFQDRIASSYNFADQSVNDTNVGVSTTKGVEIEAGTVPIAGFSAYVSGTYTRSTIRDPLLKNVANGVATYYATAGAQFPDTPKGMAAASLQWAQGPYLVNLAGKYTSSRFLTLVNDQAIKGYTTFDLNAAWKLPDPAGTGFKNPIIRLNVSNLFNRQYFLANAGSGSNITPDSTGNPVVYAGAPRFASLTFQIDY